MIEIRRLLGSSAFPPSADACPHSPAPPRPETAVYPIRRARACRFARSAKVPSSYTAAWGGVGRAVGMPLAATRLESFAQLGRDDLEQLHRPLHRRASEPKNPSSAPRAIRCAALPRDQHVDPTRNSFVSRQRFERVTHVLAARSSASVAASGTAPSAPRRAGLHARKDPCPPSNVPFRGRTRRRSPDLLLLADHHITRRSHHRRDEVAYNPPSTPAMMAVP